MAAAAVAAAVAASALLPSLFSPSSFLSLFHRFQSHSLPRPRRLSTRAEVFPRCSSDVTRSRERLPEATSESRYSVSLLARIPRASRRVLKRELAIYEANGTLVIGRESLTRKDYCLLVGRKKMHVPARASRTFTRCSTPRPHRYARNPLLTALIRDYDLGPCSPIPIYPEPLCPASNLFPRPRGSPSTSSSSSSLRSPFATFIGVDA